jgi:hypothetical protein
MPPGDLTEPPVAPEPIPVKPELPEERIPVTGSGNRTVAGLDFAAVPPGMANAASLSPSAAEAGTGGAGKRVIAGMDFTAAPPGAIPPATTRVISGPVPVTIPGTGRRNIRGVSYRALPMSGKKPVSGTRGTKPVAATRRIRSATRKVTGVDIRAVPPER